MDNLYYRTVQELLDSKLFKNISINNNHHIQLQEIINKFTKKIIRNNFLTIKGFIIYNVSGNWCDRFNNIKNLYNRDSSSLESFKERFGNEIGVMKFEEKIKKSTVDLNYCINKFGEVNGKLEYNKISIKKRSIGKQIMIDKYGEELGNKKWTEYLKNWKTSIQKRKQIGQWKNGLTLEEFIIRYGEEDGTKMWTKRKDHLLYINSLQYYKDVYGEDVGNEKWNQYCKKRDYASLNYFIKTYGENEGRLKYLERCKMISYYSSLEYYILKYGEEEGKKRKENAVMKGFLNHKFKLTRYSKISQELFWSIYDQLNDDQKSQCFFAELNKEHMFFMHKNNITVFMVDFKIKNKIIEFNGDYWHSLENVKQRDKLKYDFLIQKGYEQITILESEYLKNKSQTIKKILKFINQ